MEFYGDTVEFASVFGLCSAPRIYHHISEASSVVGGVGALLTKCGKSVLRSGIVEVIWRGMDLRHCPLMAGQRREMRNFGLVEPSRPLDFIRFEQ